MKPIKIFGKEIIEGKVVTQLENCLLEDSLGVLTADAHYGYAMPVGGCVAYKDHISVSGVGFDIGCGNKAVKTNIKASDIDIKQIMKEIERRISFGMGRVNNEKVDHQVLEDIATTNFLPQRKMAQLAASQLGTVGGGNHYVDIFKDNEDNVWVGVHFGSRGFGHKTASGFIALSQGLSFTDKGNEGSMESKPILLELTSQLGQDYLWAMHLAGAYAMAGRDLVVSKVLEILGAQSIFEVHNHHNYAWFEKHFGEEYWVVRKGCTPAYPRQMGFIGSNMSDDSVIVEGTDSENAKHGLYSTVHGAGRILSRRKAAGKYKWIKNEQTGRKEFTQIEKGLIDFPSERLKMRDKGIVLKGAGADECPAAYKNLSEVLKYQGDTIKILHTLHPIGVAMAGADVVDEYKD
jgi:tRNA-splicing ligase RtcB (3'-phosphate/5'-hydroxy nucleic acid ligase)